MMDVFVTTRGMATADAPFLASGGGGITDLAVNSSEVIQGTCFNCETTLDSGTDDGGIFLSSRRGCVTAVGEYEY